MILKKNAPIKKNKINFSKNKNDGKRRHYSVIKNDNDIQNMLVKNLKLIQKENTKEGKKEKDNDNNNIIRDNKIEEKEEKDIKSDNNKSELSGEEMNIMTYDDAKKYDKRTFSIYYLTLLRTKHILVFAFCAKGCNSRIIKIYLLLFSFAMNYAINALFFDDSRIHQIYEDGGNFNLVYQLPQIIYSSLINNIGNALIKLLALFHENILKIKNAKTEELDKVFKEEIKKIKIKLLLFFGVTYSLLVLFWYYLCCFCGVYKNSQIYLLKDSLCSFFTSLITPFGLYILPGIFRILSLKPKKKRKCLYMFSKLLQFV